MPTRISAGGRAFDARPPMTTVISVCVDCRTYVAQPVPAFRVGQFEVVDGARGRRGQRWPCLAA
eukprot:2087781-Lingulodinium_polyedra.AAC.1